MSAHEITLIPGDGIGPEVTGAASEVLAAAGVDIRWRVAEAGAEVVSKYGSALPDQVLDSIKATRVALKGPLTTPVGRGFASPNVALRKALDLFASVRPVKTLPGVPVPFRDVDLVIIRENTEGEYSGIEHLVVPGVVESLKIITEKASTRISEFAFAHAVATGRTKVTAVHKANIMKMSDGLFLECARKVARGYPDIEYEELIVDATAMHLVARPQRFQLLLMENLYGDILSDLCAGLVGGLGVVPGANLGTDYAVFEAVHGSAPDIAGKGLANPAAVILSAAMMLRHLGEEEAGARIESAVAQVLADPAHHPRDLGGPATTQQVTDAVIAALDQ
ncbi:MAG: isocitrate/isopropylmalate dehydrogenase family protein [Armatimonadetes bacterium]|nr:isocitrate/isopropylmalate dehydrogenase family protein [Armatimonadota bacterium]